MQFHLYGFVCKQNCRIWGAENPHAIHTLPKRSKKSDSLVCHVDRRITGVYLFENDNVATFF